MLTGRDIVYISSIEWVFNWQQNQEIALRLAQAGNRVLFVENTGARAPGLGDISRITSRLKRWLGALTSHGMQEVAPNVYVCSPLVLPPFGSRMQGWINRYLLLPFIVRGARRLGMRDMILWTYLPTDTAVSLIKLLRTPKSVVVYYCLTEFAKLGSDQQQMTQSEKSLVQMSDLVFTSCNRLSEHVKQWTSDAFIFPMGVDLRAFPSPNSRGEEVRNELVSPNADAMPASDPESIQLLSLPRPVIGYVGGLHRHVDFDLLAEMADSRPHWSWVFVGPLQTSLEKIEHKSNVHLLGPKPHGALASYLKLFDVCIVPYVKSDYTETVVPVKINEYLAAGKAIVSTDLPTVNEFNEQHDILITTNNRPDKFLEALELALRQPKEAATFRRRREVARLSDWGARFEAMSQLIESKLGLK